MNWQAAVVRITGSNPDKFGTGFAFYRDEQATYILTCVHVVNAVGGKEVVMVQGLTATTIASGTEDSIDLAVLSIEGFRDVPLLSLKILGEFGHPFTLFGFRSYKTHSRKTAYQIRPLHGTLGEKIGLEASEQFERIEAWDLKMADDNQLEEGYSGSPVIVDEAKGDVIGVASTREGVKKGVAISVEFLEKIWEKMPITLFKVESEIILQNDNASIAEDSVNFRQEVLLQDNIQGLLTSQDLQQLTSLLCKLPGIEYANVRHCLVSTLPARFQNYKEFDKPPEVHIAEIINTVGKEAFIQLPDGLCPILVIIHNAINLAQNLQIKLDLQILMQKIKDRIGNFPKNNGSAKSSENIKQSLENFILQIPAVQYEIQSISTLFNDYIFQIDCEIISNHLTEICTTFLDFATAIKQSKESDVIQHRFWLREALLDFNTEARSVADHINHFCEANEAVLEEEQSIEERQKIQDQLNILINRYNLVLETAKALFGILSNQSTGLGP